MDAVGVALMRDWIQRGVSVATCAKRLKVARSTAIRNLETHPADREPRCEAPLTRARMRRRRLIVKKLALKTVKKVGSRGVYGHAQPSVIERRVFPSCKSISRELAATHNITASPNTVRRDLSAIGMKARVKPCGPRRKEDDSATRLAFCKAYENHDPTTFIFSDEKCSDVNDHGGRYEWNIAGTQPSHLERDNFAPKIMVWGCIGHNVRKLVFLEGAVDHVQYQRSCLVPHIPLLTRPGTKFVQDGARCHIDHHVIKYLTGKGVDIVRDWPARSPDLNPIETMWAMIQRGVDKSAPINKEELKAFWLREWNAIPVEVVNDLVSSFHARLMACIAVEGRTLPSQWRRLLPNRGRPAGWTRRR